MKNTPIHIFLAGDSTVADYGCRQHPMAGWGQMLPKFFDRHQVVVRNYAMCGRSSRTFIEEGRLARIEREIAPGDYLLIQFGHNDATIAKPQRYVEPKHDFGKFLRQYIETARRHEAIPVLVTPMQRRNFGADGRLIYDHGPYVEAMKAVAEAEHVALLDLSAVSGRLFDSFGASGTQRWFLQFGPDVSVNYPNGGADNTHFQEAGADKMAELLIGELEKSELPLKHYLTRFRLHRVWLAGDSTMADYGGDEEPMSGWGQQIGKYFDSRHIEIRNMAVCGKSSKSFIEERRLAEILHQIEPEDYLLIQFAHNDEKLHYEHPVEEFQGYLRQYIEGARAHYAFPVLVTPVERRHFDEAGNLKKTHEPYVQAMKDLAKELSVPCIDMNAATRQLYMELGPDESKKLFMNVEPDEYPDYLDGHKDDTHFIESGADRIAQLFLEELRKTTLDLADAILDTEEGADGDD